MKPNAQTITTFAMVMLITGAIDSIRNLPATALFGPQLIFFFVLSSLLFLIPVALVSAELSATWASDENGIYHWLRLAFGERAAFLGIWLQWINTMVWYPTILSFIAGTAAYFVNPHLADNPHFLISIIVIVFWLLTLLNLKGLKLSSKFASVATLFGMIIPMIGIIALGGYWLISGHPTQLHFTPATMLPSLEHGESWISLTAIMTSFLGMELAAVHIRKMHQPQRNYPLAILCSTLIILITMSLGSLTIGLVLPQNNIHLVDGVMQTFQYFLDSYHLTFLLPCITLMILVGSVGGLINWIISPAEGLVMAAARGFIPSAFKQLNTHQVPQRVLIVQACLVTLISGGFLLLPSVNAIYWLLTALSTELYIAMYLLMFLAAITLRYRNPKQHRPFDIPFGTAGYYVTCVLGIVGCIVTLVVGFFPPDNLAMSKHLYQWLFAAGIIVMLLPWIVSTCLYRRARLGNPIASPQET